LVKIKLVREDRGAADDREMQQHYITLALAGKNPFALKCAKCGTWMFVFSREYTIEHFKLIYDEYLSMLLEDYGEDIRCPDRGFPNNWKVKEFQKRMLQGIIG